MRKTLLVVSALTIAVAAAACGDKKKKVVDADAVETMFVNFQPTLLKIMSAGIAAKTTSASGANIPTIGLVGAVQGTGGVGGQVAQSTGQNQNLNLWVELNDYSDTGDVVFQTDNTSNDTKLQFDLQITNQPPDNQMDGTLVGTLTLDGDVEGTGEFDLAFASDLMDDDNAPDLICTRVTGTVAAGTLSTSVDFVLVHLNTTLNPTQQAKCEAL